MYIKIHTTKNSNIFILPLYSLGFDIYKIPHNQTTYKHDGKHYHYLSPTFSKVSGFIQEVAPTFFMYS